MLRTLLRTRLGAIAGIGLIAAATAGALVLGSGPGASPLEAAQPPGRIAHTWMQDQHEAGTCYSTAVIDYYLGPAFNRIDQLSDSDRWLEEGSPHVFVGDIAQADVALSEAEVRVGESTAWVTGFDERGPVLRKYQAHTTPKGKTAWVMSSEQVPQSGAACEEDN